MNINKLVLAGIFKQCIFLETLGNRPPDEQEMVCRRFIHINDKLCCLDLIDKSHYNIDMASRFILSTLSWLLDVILAVGKCIFQPMLHSVLMQNRNFSCDESTVY